MVLLAHHLLMEFSNVFLLEPNKMGLSDATEQVIEITIDEPFKKRLQQVALPCLRRYDNI